MNREMTMIPTSRSSARELLQQKRVRITSFLALLVVAAFISFYAGPAIVSAAVDFQVMNCDLGEEVSAFTSSGTGPVEWLTTLDNAGTHGQVFNTCPYAEGCDWFYNSGHPSSERYIHILYTWNGEYANIDSAACFP